MITDPVLPSTLALGRSRQIVKEDWARKRRGAAEKSTAERGRAEKGTPEKNQAEKTQAI